MVSLLLLFLSNVKREVNKMGRYSLRDGKIGSKRFELTKKQTQVEAPYIILNPVADSSDKLYLYIGTANHLMLSTTAPVGTTGEFSDVGGQIGTGA